MTYIIIWHELDDGVNVADKFHLGLLRQKHKAKTVAVTIFSHRPTITRSIHLQDFEVKV